VPNPYFSCGQIKKKSIAGWGFSRYVLDAPGTMAGTMMAVDKDAPTMDRLIRLGGALPDPVQQPFARGGLRARRRQGAVPGLACRSGVEHSW
jgi:hypothetical protein